MDRTIVSLDFYGKGISVAVALFDTEKGSIHFTKLARFDSPHFQDGQVLDVGRAQDELTYVLEELAGDIGQNPKIVVGLRGPMLSFERRTGFRTRNARNCVIRESDIQEALADAVPPVLPTNTHIIDVWAQSYMVEGKAGYQNPRGLQGITLAAETLISLADASYLEDLKNILHLCNFPGYRLLASAVPIAQQLPTSTDKQGRTLLLDIGDYSTSAILYSKGLIIDGKTFAFGHNLLVKHFAKLLENDVPTAQKILDNYQEQDDVTDELIEDATALLLQHLQKELANASLPYVQNPPSQIILTGSGVTDFTTPLAKEIFHVRKVRDAILDADIATEDTNLSLFTGAVALIYHTLQNQQSGNSSQETRADDEEGFLERLLTKIGFN